MATSPSAYFFLLFVLFIRRSLKLYFPLFLRVVDFVTPHGSLGQNSLGPEQATLNGTPNIHLDCRPHITHQYNPNTSTTSEKKLERSPNELLNRQMEQGDTNAQLLGYGITRQLVLGELDTEIRVRERLQEAVESRIAWATCLQSSLGAVAEKQGACIVQG